MVKRFQKPTPEEVTEYAASIDFQLDGEHFCDFYESKGWKIGTSPMKDWQAAVRTWKRRQKADAVGRVSSPGEIASEKWLKEAVGITRGYQERIRLGLQTPSGGDPRDELSRYWKGLRDKHGLKFMDELKSRLKR